MDLLRIARTVWRHRIAVVPVLLLTLFGMLYVTVLTPPTYELTASYVLVPPPSPPTPEDRERDPALAKVRADNPFVRFASSSVIIDLLARQVDSSASREALIAAGADERFEVLPSSRFGFSSPIIDITAVGSTPESAMSTARLVSATVEKQLRTLQAAQQVDEPYMYRPLVVDFPETARLRVSNKLRSLIAIVAMGGLLTFLTVSVLEALPPRKARPRRTAPGHLAPTDSSVAGEIRPRSKQVVERTFAHGGSGR